MRDLVLQCMELEKQPSFEKRWIQEMFDRITVKYGLAGRLETDAFISRRLDGGEKTTPLKVRYWRTRQHVPKTRELCIRLGQALELTDGEMTVLLQRYYDSSDREFRQNYPESGENWISSNEDPLYHTRKNFVNGLLIRYVRRFPEGNRSPLPHYARHLFCVDALNYVYYPGAVRQERLGKHLTSSSFASEFSRTLRLLHGVPRKTVLRYLFLLYGAEVSRSRLDEGLIRLGYAPLDVDHALPGGERLDFLLISLLARYETECAHADLDQRQQWLHSHCKKLDRELQHMGQHGLRFLYFKSLRNFLQ